QLARLDGTNATSLPIRFVDADGGYVVMAYDKLQTGTGVLLYSGTVCIGSQLNPMYGDYAMENHTLRVGTFDMTNTTNSYWAFVDADDVWNSVAQHAAVDAHYGMEKYLTYLSSVHGRNGVDG